MFPGFWEEAQGIEHLSLYPLGCAHTRNTEYSVLSKNLGRRKKTNLNLGITTGHLHLKSSMLPGRQSTGWEQC